MVVAVEDPRQEPETGEVDRRDAVDIEPPSDGDDRAAVDVHVQRSGEAAALVEDVGVAQDVRAHRATFVRCGAIA